MYNKITEIKWWGWLLIIGGGLLISLLVIPSNGPWDHLAQEFKEKRQRTKEINEKTDEIIGLIHEKLIK